MSPVNEKLPASEQDLLASNALIPQVVAMPPVLAPSPPYSPLEHIDDDGTSSVSSSMTTPRSG